jgi:rhodanese-related sulfurtransferase
MLRTIVAIGAGLALFAGRAQAGDAMEGFSELSLDQVEGLIARKEADVFDNNSHDEWKQSHVPSAKWVAASEVKESVLPKDHARKLVFYCHNRK